MSRSIKIVMAMGSSVSECHGLLVKNCVQSVLNAHEMDFVLRGHGIGVHLKSTLEGKREELPYLFGKMFQNLRVSSPAPVTIEEPSGLMAR